MVESPDLAHPMELSQCPLAPVLTELWVSSSCWDATGSQQGVLSPAMLERVQDEGHAMWQLHQTWSLQGQPSWLFRECHSCFPPGGALSDDPATRVLGQLGRHLSMAGGCVAGHMRQG